MILLVDNYDLFTYNLAQYLGTFAEVQVLRNDDVGLEVAAKQQTLWSYPQVQVGQPTLEKWRL